MNIPDKSKKSKRGRKKGKKTEFVGIVEFCRINNRSLTHVYQVLRGQRESPLRNKYWKWREARDKTNPSTD